jgi:multidrug resistance efflux pump
LVKEKEAILARLRRGYLPQEIEASRQDANRARNRMEALRAKLTAMEALRSKNEVSEVEYKRIQSSARAAEAEYGAAQAKSELLEAGTPPESIAEAAAQLAIARAELSVAELAVEFCDVTAPIDGIVTSLSARQGMSVATADRLATVVNLAGLFAQVRIPNIYMESVHQGARAEVYLRALPKCVFEGHVERLSGQADPETGDLDAFILIGNEDRLLRPGLACQVRILLPAIADALVVPVPAIADRAGMPWSLSSVTTRHLKSKLPLVWKQRTRSK